MGSEEALERGIIAMIDDPTKKNKSMS